MYLIHAVKNVGQEKIRMILNQQNWDAAFESGG